MKIGICCSPFGDAYEASLKAQPDYLEINNSKAFEWTDEEFETAKENLKKNRLPLYAANGMMVGSFRLAGEHTTPAAERDAFLNKTFSRISALGVRKVVFGSGVARRVPDGFSAALAHEQLLETARAAGRIAARYDLCVVIEPLNSLETNVWTTVREAAAFVKELNEKNVRLLADSYHMAVEREPYETVGEFADLLEHTHLAEAKIGSDKFRRSPTEDDAFGVSAFVRALKACGYDGGISLECAPRTGNWSADMAQAVAAMRKWIG